LNIDLTKRKYAVPFSSLQSINLAEGKIERSIPTIIVNTEDAKNFDTLLKILSFKIEKDDAFWFHLELISLVLVLGKCGTYLNKWRPANFGSIGRSTLNLFKHMINSSSFGTIGEFTVF